MAFPIHGRSAEVMCVDPVMSNAQGLLKIDYHGATLLLPRPVIARTHLVLGR